MMTALVLVPYVDIESSVAYSFSTQTIYFLRVSIKFFLTQETLNKYLVKILLFSSHYIHFGRILELFYLSTIKMQ